MRTSPSCLLWVAGLAREKFPYNLFKAGPAGGRLRRPSSAGNDTTAMGNRPTMPNKSRRAGTCNPRRSVRGPAEQTLPIDAHGWLLLMAPSAPAAGRVSTSTCRRGASPPVSRRSRCRRPGARPGSACASSASAPPRRRPRGRRPRRPDHAHAVRESPGPAMTMSTAASECRGVPKPAGRRPAAPFACVVGDVPDSNGDRHRDSPAKRRRRPRVHPVGARPGLRRGAHPAARRRMRRQRATAGPTSAAARPRARRLLTAKAASPVSARLFLRG
jgi:hypothetical protein